MRKPTASSESRLYCQKADCRHYDEQNNFFGCHGFCWYWEKWMRRNLCFCIDGDNASAQV